MLNGYGFVLKDSNGNELVCITIALENDDSSQVSTPLKWIPFSKKPVGLRLIK